ncbi:MAG: peptidoglycan-binding domain-containing protein, partial [Candidatus Paceibacterota bacterium]
VPPSSGSRTVPCAPGQTEFCAPTLPAQASPVAVEALGQVLGATTGPIPGCGNRTTGFSSATGQSCVGNVVGQVFGAERFNFTHFLKFSPSSYKFSLQGGEVTELQKFLNTLGHNCGTVDGKFGPKTKACIVKFQLANGLKGDGIVGVLTRAILNK